jgi:hypothetical protein
LPRPLKPDDELKVPCSIVEAVVPPSGGSCSCAANARNELLPEVEPLVRQRMAQSGVCSENGGDGITPCSSFCLCEVTQVSGDAATDCRNAESTAESTNGWCYVDPDQGVGNPALVSKCPVTARRKLRFVGDGNLVNGSTTFVACSGANLNVSVSGSDAGE